jgi:hypothetical protein
MSLLPSKVYRAISPTCAAVPPASQPSLPSYPLATSPTSQSDYDDSPACPTTLTTLFDYVLPQATSPRATALALPARPPRFATDDATLTHGRDDISLTVDEVLQGSQTDTSSLVPTYQRQQEESTGGIKAGEAVKKRWEGEFFLFSTCRWRRADRIQCTQAGIRQPRRFT